MSSVRERVFAWVGVAVAILATVALSAAVIIQQVIADRTTSQTPPPELACTDSDAEPTYAVPDKFVPSQPVTSLQATDIAPGSGKAAKSGDCLVVKYYGTL